MAVVVTSSADPGDARRLERADVLAERAKGRAVHVAVVTSTLRTVEAEHGGWSNNTDEPVEVLVVWGDDYVLHRGKRGSTPPPGRYLISTTSASTGRALSFGLQPMRPDLELMGPVRVLR